jgi:Cu(I)/Ag(I) efflux system periplasmic protein CusF
MNTHTHLALTIVTAFTLALSSSAFAQDAKPAATAEAAASDADMTDAEVRKVDKEAKKITLKHEDIKNLDMPGMTMVFQVKDTALLDKTKAGDKVKFKAIKDGNAYVVTEIKVKE